MPKNLVNQLAGYAFEIIPRTLATNCGGDVVRLLTELRAKHNKEDGKTFGLDGNKGKIDDMVNVGVWEPINVKVQTLKTAIESSCMLLRIDDVVSGIKKKEKPKPETTEAPQKGDAEETVN